MLSLARTFLMVPRVLDQVCLLLCWIMMLSLVRFFHSWDMKSVRILGNGNAEDVSRWAMNDIKKLKMIIHIWTKSFKVHNYKHWLLKLFPEAEVIYVGRLKDFNWRCCGETHHLIRFHIDWVNYSLRQRRWCSPGPSRYWDREKCRRITMGSDGLILQALATSFCGRQTV